MSDMYITPKPRHLVIRDNHNSITELLTSLAKLPLTDDMAIAVVISNNDGQFNTYQFNCDAYEIACCGEALTEWSQNYGAVTLVAEPN